MRRLLLALVLACGVPVVPGHAAPRPRVPAPAERLHRAYESLALSPEAKAMLRQWDAGAYRIGRGTGEEHRFAWPMAVPDLNGDRVGDVLLSDSTYVVQGEHTVVGDTVFTLFSGRTGAPVWRADLEEPIGFPMVTPVGRDGRPGVLVLTAWLDGADIDYRFTGLGGARGEVVYDRTVTPADGLGEVQFGGGFDAMARGGTDLLVGRVRRVGEDSVSLLGLNNPGVDVTQAFVLDGKDGGYRAVSSPRVGVGGDVTFLTAGDLDGDRRDDYLVARQGLRNAGTVTAYSVSEDRQLWENADVPLGWMVLTSAPADVTGDSREDVLLDTTVDSSLVSLPGVTDQLPVTVEKAPGYHGVLLDGATGRTAWDRVDGEFAWYETFADVDHDGKVEVLATADVHRSDSGGVTLGLVDGRGRMRRHRDVILANDVPLAAVSSYVGAAGDVDADGVPDLEYDVLVGTTTVTARRASGILLGRTFATIPTTDVAFGGSLDGRGDDRYGLVTKDRTRRMSFRDGRTGAPFFAIEVVVPEYYRFALVPLPGARGRCDDVLLLAYGQSDDEDAAGTAWAARLDGVTGRIRWERDLAGDPAVPAVDVLGGRTPRCG